MKHCMNQCDFCDSKPTCFDEPREDCPDFRPNDEYRRNRIKEQVKEHDKRVLRKFAEWLLHHSMLYDWLGQNLNDYDFLSESEIIEKVLFEYEEGRRMNSIRDIELTPYFEVDEALDESQNKAYQQCRADERIKIIGWLFDNNMLRDCFGQNLKEYDLLEKEEIIATIISIYEKEQKNEDI